ncbi:MAG: hypothetical protein IID46_04390 [Planctomycetes bacterium]|nr:hypothetical protein [Planctomycetota bacterium]
MKYRHFVTAAALAVCLAQTVSAVSISPMAVQVGQTSEHTITVGRYYRIREANRVMVTGDGVTAEVVLPEKLSSAEEENDSRYNKAVRIRFTVAPQATPGIREFRIVGPWGAIPIGRVLVVRDPLTFENEKPKKNIFNNSLQTAEQVSLPATVCGQITGIKRSKQDSGTDTDWFKFKVEAGETLTFNVVSMRLSRMLAVQYQVSDPIIFLHDQYGSTLATSNNFFAADPCLSYRFERAGQYYLQIRDVRFGSNSNFHYCIEINDRPLITTLFPLAVAAGRKTQIRMAGFNLPNEPFTIVNTSQNAKLGPQLLQLPIGDDLTNPVRVVVSDLPLITESETDNNSPQTGQAIETPAGINGRIESKADVDYFTFEAKQGRHYTFEVLARRCGSQLDSHLRILDQTGKQQALSDDLKFGEHKFADSQIENWSPRVDGTYTIEIRDLHLRGGLDFTYFLKITPSRPTFELYSDNDLVPLSPGMSNVILVRVTRKNGFTGEVQLHAAGLPDGVVASCGKIPPGKTDGCIILRADDDAPLTASNITVSGTATHPTNDGTKLQLHSKLTTYMAYPANKRLHWQHSAHTVAVGKPTEIRSIKLSTTNVTLKPGESKRIDITIERTAKFTESRTPAVRFDLIFQYRLNWTFGTALPPGVSMEVLKSQATIKKDMTTGFIIIKAAPDAPPIQSHLISVMANTSRGLAEQIYSAPPVFLTITPVQATIAGE